MTTLIPKYDQGATGAVNRPFNQKLQESISLADFGAVGNGTTDDTTAINNAYAAANTAKVSLYIPSGTYKFTSQLLWDKQVNVYGETAEGSVFLKNGNFDGIWVTQGGGGATYSNFTIKGDTGNSGVGLLISDLAYSNFEKIYSNYHGSHGIKLDCSSATFYGSYFLSFVDISSSSNTGDGFRIDQTGGTGATACNVCNFQNLNLNVNGGVGFNQTGVSSFGYHYGSNIVCQNNGGGGFYICGISSQFSVYAESNTGYDVTLSSTSVRNYVIVNNSTLPPIDAGTNNFMTALAYYGTLFVPSIGNYQQATNIAGRDLAINGGSAGTGATGSIGGQLILTGGEAKGTAGAARGGRALIQGGSGVNGGRSGAVVLNPYSYDDGGVLVGADRYSTVNTSVSFEMAGTTQVFMFNNLTTAQKNALTAVAGMVVFDSTLLKLQVYDGSNWASLN